MDARGTRSLIVEAGQVYHFYIGQDRYLGMLTREGQISDFRGNIIGRSEPFSGGTGRKPLKALGECIKALLVSYVKDSTSPIAAPEEFKRAYVREADKQYPGLERAYLKLSGGILGKGRAFLAGLRGGGMRAGNDDVSGLLTPYEYAEKIRSFRGKYRGERCFIVGNGPSLNKADLSLLRDEFAFGVNGIFYKTDETGFRPTFYVVEDNHVVKDNLERINAYECMYKFFPHMYRELIKPAENVVFLPTDTGFYREHHPFYCRPRFSRDCSEVIYTGQSVTYLNLQLAFYMGFEKVYLIGMDFSYSLPESTIVQGVNYTSQEDDPNHFHPEYFGRGKKWHDPKLDRVAMCYRHAGEVFEADGRRIYNATIGGKLELFERVDYWELLGSGKSTGSIRQVYGEELS